MYSSNTLRLLYLIYYCNDGSSEVESILNSKVKGLETYKSWNKGFLDYSGLGLTT